jgi:hypothetical protein
MQVRPAEMMTAIGRNFVTGAGQEVNHWWYGNDDNDD